MVRLSRFDKSSGSAHRTEIAVALQDIPGDETRVIPNPVEKAGLRRWQPGQTDKVETGIGGDAACLNGEPILVQDRQLHEREVEGITRRPYDIGETCQLQIEFR